MRALPPQNINFTHSIPTLSEKFDLKYDYRVLLRVNLPAGLSSYRVHNEIIQIVLVSFRHLIPYGRISNKISLLQSHETEIKNPIQSS